MVRFRDGVAVGIAAHSCCSKAMLGPDSSSGGKSMATAPSDNTQKAKWLNRGPAHDFRHPIGLVIIWMVSWLLLYMFFALPIEENNNSFGVNWLVDIDQGLSWKSHIMFNRKPWGWKFTTWPHGSNIPSQPWDASCVSRVSFKSWPDSSCCYDQGTRGGTMTLPTQPFPVWGNLLKLKMVKYLIQLSSHQLSSHHSLVPPVLHGKMCTSARSKKTKMGSHPPTNPYLTQLRISSVPLRTDMGYLILRTTSIPPIRLIEHLTDPMGCSQA